jgi:sulfur-oxidizing protein SoxY
VRLISRRTMVKVAAVHTAAAVIAVGGSSAMAAEANQDFPADLIAAINQYTKGSPYAEKNVSFEIAELIDNGNNVPISVAVQSPLPNGAYVTGIAVFNEKNPNRDIARFVLSQYAGKAQVATRIRLATTQRLIAIAQMSDGSYFSKTVDVIVTLAACIESE